MSIEALVAVLQKNPAGVQVHRDELTGWLRGMNQYKSGGKGADRAHYLSIWGSEPLVVDRKSNVDEPIIVSKPVISLFGGLQPQMLRELGGSMEDGMMERFLFAYPNIRHIKHSWYEISDEATRRYKQIFNALWRLSQAIDKDSGKLSLKPLSLTFRAKQRFQDLLETISTESLESGFPPRMEAAWSKFRGYLPRLALVLAVCRFNTTDAEVE